MVSIKKANSEIKEADVSYLGKNILTKISKDTEGNSLVELAFKDKPEFSELTLGGTSLRIDNGNLTIGGNTVVTTNNIGSQEISYKVNDETTISKVSLNTGFTFKGDMDNNIKVSKDNDGIINFNLSSTLSGITSISNGDKKIEITNEGVKIGDVTINGNTINIKNVDATKTPQNGDVITYEYFNKTINNLNVGKATQDELDKKANKDASNLDDGDITKWKEKLGVTNLDLKVQGTNGSYTTTLANGVVFENGDIDVKATASNDTSKKEGKLKLTLKEEYKKKLNAIDIEDNKKLSDVYLKVDASNLSDTGVNNLITKLGTGNGALTDSNKNKLVTGNTLDATLQSKFIKFMGDENTTYDGNEQGTKVNLDGTLNIKGGVVRKEKDKDDETKEKELQNILVKTDKDKISLDLSKDLYGMNSIEFVNKHGNKSNININDNGDLGISMYSGFKAVYQYIKNNNIDDKGLLFKNLSVTFNEEAPSSLGTIISIFLMGMARNLKNKTNPTKDEYILAMEKGYEYLNSKLDTQLGDKTIFDTLEPAINVLVKTKDRDKAFEIAKIKTEETKNMISKKGRAQYHGQKTLGYIDGGAYVAYLVFKSIKEYDKKI